jgi:YfiH family protein
MRVAHGNTVIEAEESFSGKSLRNWKKAPYVDGLFTNKRNNYLFLLTADCIPAILYDPRKNILGLLHVGWKNADLNTVLVMMNKLKAKFKINPSDLIVGFGPSVRKDAFIKENPLQKDDPKWQPFMEKVGKNKYKVDVCGLCRNQFITEGINDENIFDCLIDTSRDRRFYSHSRDKNKPPKEQGRFACVVGIKD